MNINKLDTRFDQDNVLVTEFGCSMCGKCALVNTVELGTPEHIEQLRDADICEAALASSGVLGLALRAVQIPQTPAYATI